MEERNTNRQRCDFQKYPILDTVLVYLEDGKKRNIEKETAGWKKSREKGKVKVVGRKYKSGIGKRRKHASAHVQSGMCEVREEKVMQDCGHKEG